MVNYTHVHTSQGEEMETCVPGIWSKFEKVVSHRIQSYTKQFNSELCMDAEHEVKQSSKTKLIYRDVVPQSF